MAFETLHYLKRKTQRKLGYMAFKLDMRKAYNKAEWDFLEKAMLHLGFHWRFVATIMSCIKLVSYSILLNGVPGGHIKPSKGLRQGDSLSPYLFLVCDKETHYHHISGFKAYFIRPNLMVPLEGCRFAKMVLGCLIFSL